MYLFSSMKSTHTLSQKGRLDSKGAYYTAARFLARRSNAWSTPMSNTVYGCESCHTKTVSHEPSSILSLASEATDGLA